MCCAGVGTLSAHETTTGQGFSSPNQPDQERTVAYCDSSGPESRSDVHSATIVGDWEKPSGETWVRDMRASSIGQFTLHGIGLNLPVWRPVVVGLGLLAVVAATSTGAAHSLTQLESEEAQVSLHPSGTP